MSRPAKERTYNNDDGDLPMDGDEYNCVSAPSLLCPHSITAASLLYAFTFFSSMVLMELILEGTQNAFMDFLGLPYAVTLFQFIACWGLPVAISKGMVLQQLPTTARDIFPYVFLSLVAFGSTCFKSLSARYVSFPTKVIFKSTKLIPTMMVSTLFQNNSENYSHRDYLAALLLCMGAAGYSYGESTKNDDKEDSYFGLILLGVSVLCDAFTPNLQQRFMAPLSPPATLSGMSSQKPHVKEENMEICSWGFPRGGGGLGLSASVLMSNTNALGIAGTLIFMLLSGHVHDAMGVALVRPHLLGNLMVIGLFLALAVLSHIRLIKESGAVIAVAVATLREVATVILSYIVYPKVFSKLHAFSALLVLVGIVLTMTCGMPVKRSASSTSCNNSNATKSNPRKDTGEG